MAWLFCLTRLGVLTEADYPAVVLRVFVKVGATQWAGIRGRTQNSL